MLPQYIMVPLYIYPAKNAWNNLYNAITNNPTTQFKVIINPASGPGTSVPDANWRAGISQLNGYANTQLLGYVDTAFATRNYAATQKDIDQFAAWSSYTAQDIHMDGIFFDDNPNQDDANLLTYITNITSYARQKMPNSKKTGKTYLTLNPGTTVSDKYYNIADSIIAFEDVGSAFSAAVVAGIPKTQRAKSVFIIHDAPTGKYQNMMNLLLAGGIPGSYLTSASDYNVWGGNFAGYAKNLAAGSFVVGGSSTTKATATAGGKGLAKGLAKVSATAGAKSLTKENGSDDTTDDTETKKGKHHHKNKHHKNKEEEKSKREAALRSHARSWRPADLLGALHGAIPSAA